jgi:carbon-monoxide dehydrogenase medium subunit
VTPSFQLHRPRALPEALDLLASLGDAARIYAGGTELLLVLREGFLEADHLVDIKRIDELNGVTVEPASETGGTDTISIGAATVHTDVERSRAIRDRLPGFAALAADIANVRVRNTGTLGGNLCFAEPHGDPATFLIAADAELRLASAAGTRTVPLDGWVAGPFEVDVAPGEILTSIRVPVPSARTTYAYHRFRSLERPTAAVAVRLDVSGTGVVDGCRVVLGCAGPRPVRLSGAESAMLRTPLREVRAVISDIARAAADEADVDDDAYGPSDYKRHLVAVLARRAVLDAASRQPTAA